MAENCERGQPVLHKGQPVPLAIPALIQYDDLYVRPESRCASDREALVRHDWPGGAGLRGSATINMLQDVAGASRPGRA